MESAEFDSPRHHGEHQGGADTLPQNAQRAHEHENHSTHSGEHDGEHGAGHGAHVDHTGHEEMFRNRFWVCLALSIPVLLYSPTIQGWLGFTAPPFPGSQWVTPVFSVIVFLYGGVPFLRMAVPELRDGRPGMMTLISLAISVAFVYSLAALFFDLGAGFFWELVTLIDVMFARPLAGDAQCAPGFWGAERARQTDA
jgi:Cu2+-exporting ATPase